MVHLDVLRRIFLFRFISFCLCGAPPLLRILSTMTSLAYGGRESCARAVSLGDYPTNVQRLAEGLKGRQVVARCMPRSRVRSGGVDLTGWFDR